MASKDICHELFICFVWQCLQFKEFLIWPINVSNEQLFDWLTDVPVLVSVPMLDTNDPNMIPIISSNTKHVFHRCASTLALPMAIVLSSSQMKVNTKYRYIEQKFHLNWIYNVFAAIDSQKALILRQILSNIR